MDSSSLWKPDKQAGSLGDKSFVPRPVVLTHCVMGYVCEVHAFDEVPQTYPALPEVMSPPSDISLVCALA